MPIGAEGSTADEFERHRGHLTGLGYRMLGSIAAAEDAVQEAYLRWRRADRSGIDNSRAFLSKIVTRLCLDEMKSARSRRETYIGPWLPEPVLQEAELSAESASEYAHDLSVGLMLALERLSPLERAAFLLHDVFGVDYGEVAKLIERNEPACRQLAARARANVRAARPRFEMPADGGGKRKAALRIIAGRDPVVQAVVGAVLRESHIFFHFPPFAYCVETVEADGDGFGSGRLIAVSVVTVPSA